MRRVWEHNWIVVMALIVHGLWGGMLLVTDVPEYTSPHRLQWMLSFAGLGHKYWTAAVYLLATVLAAVAVLYPRLEDLVWDGEKMTTGTAGVNPHYAIGMYVGLLLCSLQQLLLMISFFTSVAAVILGHYPDGYAPDVANPRVFLLVERSWPMVGMVCHTIALLDWYIWSRYERHRE